MTNISTWDDHMLVEALLLRNEYVTQQYLYIKCYPLFKSVYDNYYTDCQSCMEFINEIYIHLLLPNQYGECKLQTFRFGSTLTTWLKVVAVYYCYEHFRKKKKITVVEQKNEEKDGASDRFDLYSASVYHEADSMEQSDVETILSMMPNKRYAMIIRLRYIDCLSNEEAAAEMGMSLDNFYNKHMRAKKQFIHILKKEEQYGRLY